ncbi:MAG: cytochrome b562 [Vibrio sp.]
MLKVLTTILLGASISFGALANADVGKTMQLISGSYGDALGADSIADMKQAVTEMSSLVTKAKQADYKGDNPKAYQEGLTKLKQALKGVNKDLDNGNLAQAKTDMRKISSLRNEYHSKTR